MRLADAVNLSKRCAVVVTLALEVLACLLQPQRLDSVTRDGSDQGTTDSDSDEEASPASLLDEGSMDAQAVQTACWAAQQTLIGAFTGATAAAAAAAASAASSSSAGATGADGTTDEDGEDTADRQSAAPVGIMQLLTLQQSCLQSEQLGLNAFNQLLAANADKSVLQVRFVLWEVMPVRLQAHC